MHCVSNIDTETPLSDTLHNEFIEWSYQIENLKKVKERRDRKYQAELHKIWEDPETTLHHLYAENVAGRLKLVRERDAVEELEAAYEEEYSRKMLEDGEVQVEYLKVVEEEEKK